MTRPRERGARLAGLIEAAGGEALRYPAIEIAPPAETHELLRIVDALASFDLAIFVSPTAVRAAFGLLRSRSGWPPSVPVAAVGPGTRRELEKQGLRAVIAPASGGDSESLLAQPQLAAVGGRRVVIFRGAGGRELLGEALAARGALLAYAECYRRVRPQAELAALTEEWRRGGVDAVTVFSAEALANLADTLGSATIGGTPFFVSHRRIAEEALRRGIRAVTADGPGEDEMRARLVAYFGHAK